MDKLIRYNSENIEAKRNLEKKNNLRKALSIRM